MARRAHVYSAERDVEDGRAFLEQGRNDRHQFRFIVAAEDGVELSDLRTTTRDLGASSAACSQRAWRRRDRRRVEICSVEIKSRRTAACWLGDQLELRLLSFGRLLA
jgi:hypothetical protein